MKKQNKGIILAKYGAVVAILLIFCVMIFASAVRGAFPSEERERWRQVGRDNTRIPGRTILPTRGNIYTHDGRLLAASEPSYVVMMDFRAAGMVYDSLMKHVDALSAALARKFPDRTAAQYRNIIVNGWQQRNTTRHVRIISREISFFELQEIRTFPFWNQISSRSGLVTQGRNARVNPFGSLAIRTVGSVFGDIEKGGSSGLEQKFDEKLRGIEGVRDRQRIHGRWRDVVVTPAIDGYDIVTTIDADIQDITERSLRNTLIETNSEAGTAIVMEVQSGAIRGIANLDRVRRGVYAERNPNAFSWMHEPGSTFKTIATLVALEDGIVQPTDSFFVGHGRFPFRGAPQGVIRDWNEGPNRGYQTVQWGMEMSSNIVMARMVLQGYRENPRRFVEGIHRTGLRDSLTWDIPLQGREGTVNIRFPGEGHFWANTTLPMMSYGYETQVPPIHMLMFHNAIANGGRMIQPFVAQRIKRDGRTVREFSARVVNPQIASRRTVMQIHDMLVGVVERGTATSIQSNYFGIAGKTGTAVLAAGGGYGAGHYVSFVGYFPADNPRYSIFVGIRNPDLSIVGRPSGARQAGTVFRDIAEQIFVRNERLSVEHVPIDANLPQEPIVNHGKWQHNRTLLSSLRLPVSDTSEAAEWVRMTRDSVGHQPRALAIDDNTVPDVRGMGARDALYLLERAGLQVNLRGSGRVREQSLAPGSRLVRGGRIDIVLR